MGSSNMMKMGSKYTENYIGEHFLIMSYIFGGEISLDMTYIIF